MDIAVLLLLVACLAAGVSGALAVNWQLHRRTFRLEIRVNDLEEIAKRQGARQAAKVRWQKTDEEAAALAQAVRSAGRVPSQPVNPWIEAM